MVTIKSCNVNVWKVIMQEKNSIKNSTNNE